MDFGKKKANRLSIIYRMSSPTNTADTPIEEPSLKQEGPTVSKARESDPLDRFSRDVSTRVLRKPLNFIERLLSKNRYFQATISKAFDFVDVDGSGAINKQELYTGMLIVRLKIAKHAGSSACYPPSRAECDQYFAESDRDGSGTIDREEFHKILEILTTNILTGTIAYYSSIILALPYPVSFLLKLLRVPEGTYYEWVSREAITTGVYFLFIPLLCNIIEHLFSDEDQPKLTAHREQSEKQSGEKEGKMSSFI